MNSYTVWTPYTVWAQLGWEEKAIRVEAASPKEAAEIVFSEIVEDYHCFPEELLVVSSEDRTETLFKLEFKLVEVAK